MADFIEYLSQHQEAFEYLPDEQDLMNLPRAYLINVIYSIVGDDFRAWVDQRVNFRNEQFKI